MWPSSWWVPSVKVDPERAARIERGGAALAERYRSWSWSRSRWNEIARLVLEAADES